MKLLGSLLKKLFQIGVTKDRIVHAGPVRRIFHSLAYYFIAGLAIASFYGVIMMMEYLETSFVVGLLALVFLIPVAFLLTIESVICIIYQIIVLIASCKNFSENKVASIISIILSVLYIPGIIGGAILFLSSF